MTDFTHARSSKAAVKEESMGIGTELPGIKTPADYT